MDALDEMDLRDLRMKRLHFRMLLASILIVFMYCFMALLLVFYPGAVDGDSRAVLLLPVLLFIKILKIAWVLKMGIFLIPVFVIGFMLIFAVFILFRWILYRRPR